MKEIEAMYGKDAKKIDQMLKYFAKATGMIFVNQIIDQL